MWGGGGGVQISRISVQGVHSVGGGGGGGGKLPVEVLPNEFSAKIEREGGPLLPPEMEKIISLPVYNNDFCLT